MEVKQMDNDKLTDKQIEQISNKVIHKLCSDFISDFIKDFKFVLVVAAIFLCMLIGLCALLKSINQELYENFLEILKYT
jgi:hypothetical protein